MKHSQSILHMWLAAQFPEDWPNWPKFNEALFEDPVFNTTKIWSTVHFTNNCIKTRFEDCNSAIMCWEHVRTPFAVEIANSFIIKLRMGRLRCRVWGLITGMHITILTEFWAWIRKISPVMSAAITSISSSVPWNNIYKKSYEQHGQAYMYM